MSRSHFNHLKRPPLREGDPALAGEFEAGDEGARHRRAIQQRWVGPYGAVPARPQSIQEQAAVYDEIHRKAFGITRDFVGALGEEYMTMLASGDLRGTNPTNAAARYSAVMLAAAWLRDPARWARAGTATGSTKMVRSHKAPERASADARGRGAKRVARRALRALRSGAR